MQTVTYPLEQFTEEEQARLAPHFTNLDRPVFALVNLPETVKGALFARYSRSDKSLRRLFLDEFVGDLDISGDLTVDLTRRRVTSRGAEVRLSNKEWDILRLLVVHAGKVLT